MVSLNLKDQILHPSFSFGIGLSVAWYVQFCDNLRVEIFHGKTVSNAVITEVWRHQFRMHFAFLDIPNLLYNISRIGAQTGICLNGYIEGPRS